MEKLSLEELVPDKDYYIEGQTYKASGIYVRSEVVDRLFTLLYFKDIINVKDGTPHKMMKHARDNMVCFLKENTIVYKKLQPRSAEMDSHNMERIRENYFRLKGVAGLAGNVSQGPIARFKKEIKNVEEVKKLILESGIAKEGTWQHVVWDDEHKIYILPPDWSSSSEKKGGFSRKNKKGKKRKGISLKNRISKVNV